MFVKCAEQKEKDKVIEAEDKPKMGTLILLNAVCNQTTRNPPPSMGLMYIDMKINDV